MHPYLFQNVSNVVQVVSSSVSSPFIFPLCTFFFSTHVRINFPSGASLFFSSMCLSPCSGSSEHVPSALFQRLTLNNPTTCPHPVSSQFLCKCACQCHHVPIALNAHCVCVSVVELLRCAKNVEPFDAHSA